MRKQFFNNDEAAQAALDCGFTTAITPALSDRVANKLAPWHAVCVQVTGGWMFFESAQDYEVWKSQK